MDIKKAPAPWKLYGNGYIFLYKFDKSFLANQNLSLDLDSFAGGLGAVMLVDYLDSNVGPYKEILFIPGKFIINNKKWNNIPKIYVSTQDSVVNGKENWGIPKEQADFVFTAKGASKKEVKISIGNEDFFKATLKSFGPKFPVTTSFIPFPLMQKHGKDYLQTTFSGKGWGRLVKIEDMDIDPKYFPNIIERKPLLVVEVQNFNIVFPEPARYFS